LHSDLIHKLQNDIFGISQAYEQIRLFMLGIELTNFDARSALAI
jgi:hypothetical protein